MSHRRLLKLTVAIIALLFGFIGGFMWALSQEKTDSEIRLGKDLAPIQDSRLQEELRIAREIWGQTCDGSVAVAIAPLTKNRSGLASWIDSDGKRTACAIVISDRRLSREIRCAVVVHEWGHLANQPHSQNPRSVMFQRVSGQNTPRRCKL